MAHAFRALRHSRFRVFWIGQGISVSGTWMQSVAQGWLVYRLTNSPLQLGILAVARFGPSLVGSPFAGAITDRFSRRTLVLATQTASLVQASVLAALTLSGAVRVWHVLVLAAFQGIVDTLDMPARQTLQVDLVGVEDLQSAVSLNSSMFNAARMLGPAVAGRLVASFGEGVCFAVNAVSYLAVLAALLMLRLPASPPARHTSLAREVHEGLQYAWRRPDVRAVLFAVVVTSALGLSYSTLLPVFARDVLHAGAPGYGLLLAGAGLGAIVGAIAAASLRSDSQAMVMIAVGQGALGIGLIGFSAARTMPLAIAGMVLIGLAVAIQLATTNGYLQTSSPPALRGRVVSLYIWLFVGLSPLGGLAAGWLAEHVGATSTAAIAGCLCTVSAALTGAKISPLMRGARHHGAGREAGRDG